MKVLQHGTEEQTPRELLVTYPENSPVVNPRHFYQTSVADWCKKQQRQVSLRQLAFFGRNLTEERIMMSANFVREELPIRIAHRLEIMQRMPYRILSNPRLTSIYERYYLGFEKMRRIPRITNMKDNEKFCSFLSNLLDVHNNVVADLLLGVMEAVSRGDVHDPDRVDQFVRGMLSSRISRRVLAEQHISLSNSFLQGNTNDDKDQSYVGEVFLQCTASDIIDTALKNMAHVIPAPLPEVKLEGNTEASFPYIQSHMNFIVTEVLRNSMEACKRTGTKEPILVSVSSTKENVFIRISDQGGGLTHEALGSLWTFAKPYSSHQVAEEVMTKLWPTEEPETNKRTPSASPSLQTLTLRDSGVHLGIGLPLARVYLEYWGGTIELHSLEGYGCDTLIRISRLGTMLENLNLDKV